MEVAEDYWERVEELESQGIPFMSYLHKHGYQIIRTGKVLVPEGREGEFLQLSADGRACFNRIVEGLRKDDALIDVRHYGGAEDVGKLVFEYVKAPAKGKGSTHLRIDTAAYEMVEEIAAKCRLTITEVASRLVRHALEDVVLKEVPLCDLGFDRRD